MSARLELISLVCVIGLSACGSSNSNTAETGKEQLPTTLRDGSHDCEVMNTTRGNGPYTLECEKSGDDITIHFNNGGYITLDMDSQESADGSTWELEGTNLQDGESWQVTINQ
jgi:hypothetical protein